MKQKSIFTATMSGLVCFEFLTTFSQTSQTIPTEPTPTSNYKSKEVSLTYKEQSYESATTITTITTGIATTIQCIGEGMLICTAGEETSWIERIEVIPIIPETDVASIHY